ncbi:MAG: ABC transporter substrate-binding protein, partial [Clostridia bacterium]
MKKSLALVMAALMALSMMSISCAVAETADLGTDLNLYSTMTEGDLEALLAGFGERYPDITVEVVSGTIGETTSRIAAEAADPQGDVVWGGLADSDGTQYADLFEAWVSQYASEAIEGYAC